MYLGQWLESLKEGDEVVVHLKRFSESFFRKGIVLRSDKKSVFIRSFNVERSFAKYAGYHYYHDKNNFRRIEPKKEGFTPPANKEKKHEILFII